MSDLFVANICIQTQKQLATLNNFLALLKNVLIDLSAHNFVRARHCARDLLSPVRGHSKSTFAQDSRVLVELNVSFKKPQWNLYKLDTTGA